LCYCYYFFTFGAFQILSARCHRLYYGLSWTVVTPACCRARKLLPSVYLCFGSYDATDLYPFFPAGYLSSYLSVDPSDWYLCIYLLLVLFLWRMLRHRGCCAWNIQDILCTIFTIIL
jgi:hypothetical protein